MRVDNFAKNNIIMFCANSLGSLMNLLYQFIMLRLLPREIFASLNTLLSVLVIISVPAAAFNTMVTKHISTSYARKEVLELKATWRKLSLHAVIFAMAAFLIIFLASKNISHFLKVSSYNSVVILGAIVALSSIIPVINAGLQALEKFKWFAVIIISVGAIKLASSIGFISSIAEKLDGALIGFLASLIFYIMISLIPLNFMFKGASKGELNLGRLYFYILPVTAVSLCFALLTNIDMILVKHFFLRQAQDYALAQMIGKIILFIPGMIYMVMFSRVSSLYALKENSRGILKRSILYTFAACIFALAVFNLFPGFIMKILSGVAVSRESILLARFFSFVMFFFSLSNLLFYYQLSIESYGFIRKVILLTVLQIIFIILFHKTTLWIIAALLLNSIALFIFNLRSALRASE